MASHPARTFFYARACAVGLIIFAAVMAVQCASAQSLPRGESWRYTLLEGSHIVDDCLLCGRPSIMAPLRGTFDLALLEDNGFFTRYELRAIDFRSGAFDTPFYWVRGSGVWTLGGEVALRQDMSLSVGIDDGGSATSCYFTNVDSSVTRRWPMMEITLGQTNGTLFKTYSLTIVAAPVREAWFSTTSGFTSSNEPGLGPISPGDLVSASGRMVKRNRDLTALLGIQPIVNDYGLDAVDIQPGAEILFSMNRDAFSERLGQIRHGDIVSAQGQVYRRNTELLSSFDPDSNVDAGLDALLLRPGGEVWFSVRSNVVSRKLGGILRRGDLLSSSGVVVRAQQQLLSRFHPNGPAADYGLDALHIWANGEIWFSTEDGFQDQQLGPVGAGDLLSDEGVVVFRNRDLLARFDPARTVSDFGLDALFLVSDTFAASSRPTFTTIEFNNDGSPHIAWRGEGRVFQLESTFAITGSMGFHEAGPIVADLFFDVPVRNAYFPKEFYRLRQW